MGVEARMAVPHRPQEKITRFRGRSLGLIELAAGSIRWVCLKTDKYAEYGPDWYAEYGVPDLRLIADFPQARVKGSCRTHLLSTRRRAAFRWHPDGFLRSGSALEEAIATRLSSDTSLNAAALASGEIWIRSHQACWIITSNEKTVSPVVWTAYQAIAHHLLEITRQLQP